MSDAEVQAYWDAHKSELAKDKKTATFAKAKTTIEQTLLCAKQQQLWTAWWPSGQGDRRGLRRGLRPRRADASTSASPAAGG